MVKNVFCWHLILSHISWGFFLRFMFCPNECRFSSKWKLADSAVANPLIGRMYVPRINSAFCFLTSHPFLGPSNTLGVGVGLLTGGMLKLVPAVKRLFSTPKVQLTKDNNAVVRLSVLIWHGKTRNQAAAHFPMASSNVNLSFYRDHSCDGRV